MTVWVIDPACNQASSHHIPLNDALHKRCRSRGMDIEIGVNRALAPGAASTFDGLPMFESGINYARDDNPYQAFADMAFANAMLEEELEKWIGDRLQAGDQLVMHTGTFEQLTGLAIWLSKRPDVPVELRIVLRFHPGFRAPEIQHPALTALYRYGIDQLQALKHVRSAFFADTIRLAELFEQTMGLPFELSPVPIDFSHFEALPPERRVLNPKGPRGLLFAGEPRPEKGFSLVSAALNHHLSMPEMRFLAILQSLSYEPKDLGWSEAALARTRFLPGSLPPPDYYKLIALAGAVLVPYDAKEYTYRSSHILVEALGFGRPVVAIRDGWMHDEITRMGSEPAVVFADAFTATAVTAAVGQLLDQWEEVVAAATRESAKWRAFHNIDRFVDLMLGERNSGEV